MAPFGSVVTQERQISHHFMEDLKRLAYYDFQWLDQFGLDVLLGIDVNLYLTLFFLYESSIKIALVFYGKKGIPSNFLIDQNYHSYF